MFNIDECRNLFDHKRMLQKIVTTLLPTEEELRKIAEAVLANPELPLGSAEMFLETLGSIPHLEPRLKLWAFKLDFEVAERVSSLVFVDIVLIFVLVIQRFCALLMRYFLGNCRTLNGLEMRPCRFEKEQNAANDACCDFNNGQFLEQRKGKRFFLIDLTYQSFYSFEIEFNNRCVCV